MKLKKLIALGMATVMTLSLTACGGGSNEVSTTKDSSNDTVSNEASTTDTKTEDDTTAEGSELTYASITLGEDYTDLTASIKWMHHKTDREEDGTIQAYIDKFNETYPNITVEHEGITDYAESALLRLPMGDWGDIMFIPSIDMVDLETYFLPYGTVSEMSELVNFADQWKYQDMCYGVGYMGNAQGVLYNKAVFEKAGITKLPTTPDEFIADLQLIKDNTDAIPLYTNYAAGWTMGGQWDSYLGAITTGDTTWLNQKFTHTAEPFANAGDGTGAYALYKVLYDAVANGLIEDDYAGIGGTTSQFGVARADKDLLSYDIDFTTVEFSVNDDDNEHFLETYEGLIRKIYSYKTDPAILIINSVRYDDGINAQMQHVKVGKEYDIPCVSMKPVMYSKILDGTYKSRDITEDDLHPNDEGHALMAAIVIDFLDNVYNELISGNEDINNNLDIKNMTPMSENAYENSTRYQNYNCEDILIENEGFAVDERVQNDIREIFRNGWTADKKGASISFVIEGSCIAVQYRKSVVKPTCIAKVTIDDDIENARILDGNFEETWGDSLHLDTIAEHIENKKHKVKIEIIETHSDDKVPFYLVSVISSR